MCEQIHILVFCFMKLCSLVCGYKRFVRTYRHPEDGLYKLLRSAEKYLHVMGRVFSCESYDRPFSQYVRYIHIFSQNNLVEKTT
jgi:hypothetical protein